MGKGKKNKKKKSVVWFYLGNIILGVIIIIVAAFIAMYMFCNVHDVQVVGSKYYDPIEIEEYVLTGKYKNNAVYVTFDNALHPKKNIPFVESAKVKMTSYDKVEIKVKEKAMMGFMAVADGTFAYFNDEGEVVEVSDRILDDILPVSGVVLESAEVGQHVAIDEKQLNNMLNIIKVLRKNNVAVTSGNFDEAGNFGVFSGAVYINFGNGSDIDEKVKRLNYILPKLVDMSGILHLEDWSTQDTDIVFEKTTE